MANFAIQKNKKSEKMGGEIAKNGKKRGNGRWNAKTRSYNRSLKNEMVTEPIVKDKAESYIWGNKKEKKIDGIIMILTQF